MKKNRSIHNVTRFLYESNAIESVFDETSLEQATLAWRYLANEKKITLENILKTHRLLMSFLLPEKDKGSLRKVDVGMFLANGEFKKFKSWKVVPKLLNDWIEKANKSKTEEEIKQDHIELLKIHPWLDGNGRCSRIIMNYQRIKVGLPILVIYESQKQKYYSWFD